MKEELEQQLMDRFDFMEARNVFTDEKLGFPTGCSCGDGWAKIIWDLCEKIDDKLAELPNKFELRILEIKEKYGGLRFYTGSIPTQIADDIYEYIRDAEDLSYETCEKCGMLGQPNTSGWIQTLCDDCRRKKNHFEDCY